MPIAINGSGTVTGLAVGGLPDGSVDRDTLATAAKGSILQVVQGFTTTYTATTSTSYVDSTLTKAITPTAASSKILIQISQACNMSVSTYNAGMYLQLVRDSSAIYTPPTQSFYFFFGSGNNSVTTKHRYNFMYLDSPSYSLGATLTYKTQQKAFSDAATTSARTQPTSDQSYIILSEVAA
jgi:hypothetical protein|tara:strand:- start:1199 stop:1741 length:543 start_codon:yes stop_codon:yes gene_type:complete